ncbi:hypothetical protein B0J18DRAFT_85236 [Chaetomium sp. MPI-SDFR-AT-0129]|nr:hypothetical protein B0J18DRAFT_85236 [Chaetomium sp. MPI-SDFR-AT-0129]
MSRSDTTLHNRPASALISQTHDTSSLCLRVDTASQEVCQVPSCIGRTDKLASGLRCGAWCTSAALLYLGRKRQLAKPLVCPRATSTVQIVKWIRAVGSGVLGSRGSVAMISLPAFRPYPIRPLTRPRISRSHPRLSFRGCPALLVLLTTDLVPCAHLSSWTQLHGEIGQLPTQASRTTLHYTTLHYTPICTLINPVLGCPSPSDPLIRSNRSARIFPASVVHSVNPHNSTPL